MMEKAINRVYIGVVLIVALIICIIVNLVVSVTSDIPILQYIATAICGFAVIINLISIKRNLEVMELERQYEYLTTLEKAFRGENNPPKTENKLHIKCAHDLCMREAVGGSEYCRECIQLPTKECNFCKQK
jgi:hypothetical protein